MGNATPAGPDAALEAELVSEYLRGHGFDPQKLRELPDAEAKRWMRQASMHASARLTELEARARFSHHFQDARGAGGPSSGP